jgi:hypothetical protein
MDYFVACSAILRKLIKLAPDWQDDHGFNPGFVNHEKLLEWLYISMRPAEQ